MQLKCSLNEFQMVYKAMCYFDLDVSGIHFFNKLQTFNTSANLLCDLLLCDSTWLALTIGGPGSDHSPVGVFLALHIVLTVTVWCVNSKGLTYPVQTVLPVPKKIQNVPNPVGRLLVIVKRLLRKTLWLKTTVLLWLRTSWWGVGWRLILALDLPTWWVPFKSIVWVW